MIICGIDPGKSGAVALFRDGKLVDVQDMPMISVQVNGKDRDQQNPQALADMLYGSKVDHVYLERVGVRPMEGAVGAFSFGRGFGQIEGILAGGNIPYTLVMPQVWKKKLGVPADKGGARQFATRMFPAFAKSFARVKDDGRAEASLIALYGSTAP